MNTIYEVGEYTIIKTSEFMEMEHHMWRSDLIVSIFAIVTAAIILDFVFRRIYGNKEDH